MPWPRSTCSATKSSNAVISKASSAISSTRLRGDDHDAVAVAQDRVAGKDRRVAAADRHVDVDRLVQGEVGGRAGPLVIGREAQPGDLRRIAEAAVGHHARHAAPHQPRHQDRAGRRRARVLAAVHHQHGAGRTILDRLALRMAAVAEHFQPVQVLARRHVTQGEGRADQHRLDRRQRMHVLDGLVAKAALEQGGRTPWPC